MKEYYSTPTWMMPICSRRLNLVLVLVGFVFDGHEFDGELQVRPGEGMVRVQDERLGLLVHVANHRRVTAG